jgi:hypothetical protein
MRYLFICISIAIFATNTSAQSNFESSVLQLHNAYRNEVKVKPLIWDETLAATAKEYANYLLKTNKFEHSKKYNVGENLWRGTTNYFTLEKMIKDWGSEKQYFVNKPCPHFSTTGNFADVGHYTQIIWNTTEKVGCALVSNNKIDVLVCHYKNAGNIVGIKAY